MPAAKLKSAKTRQRARSLKSRPEIATAENVVYMVDVPRCGRLLETLSSEERKQYPLTTGLQDYFPDALAEVAHISWAGNEKHNPGEPLHWARGKSMDHADCAGRHLQQRGTVEDIEVNGKKVRVRHTAQLAWRALALLQEELEAEFGYDLPRGATAPT
jgi:hypothetical protein